MSIEAGEVHTIPTNPTSSSGTAMAPFTALAPMSLPTTFQSARWRVKPHFTIEINLLIFAAPPAAQDYICVSKNARVACHWLLFFMCAQGAGKGSIKRLKDCTNPMLGGGLDYRRRIEKAANWLLCFVRFGLSGCQFFLFFVVLKRLELLFCSSSRYAAGATDEM